MSNVRFRRLEQRGARRVGDRVELSMKLPRTPSGMEMRHCPQEGCTPQLFQLGDVVADVDLDKDADASARAAGTTCPYCGHHSDDDHDFVDPQDIEALTEWFTWATQEDISDAFTNMIERVGRGFPRGGPISLQVSTDRRRRPEPRAWRQDLLRDLTCPSCSRRYGVYAIALFCPDCGLPNLSVHFNRECELVEQQVELARQTDSPELAFRLLGNAHEDVVTALETYLKTAYRHVVARRLPDEAARLTSTRSIGNTFQNIERARRRFEPLGMDPFDVLGDEDLEFLRLNIEKRHVLGHNLGLADERYAEVASSVLPGRTVSLLGDEVLRFSRLSAQVIGALEREAFQDRAASATSESVSPPSSE